MKISISVRVHFQFPLLPQAQIDYLTKEINEKDRPKYEKDALVVIATQVQQLLQQHQQQQNEQQQKKEQQQQQKEQNRSTDQQHKEHQQPPFVGKVYV